MKKKNWEYYEFYSIPFNPLNKIIQVWVRRENGLVEIAQAFDMKSFIKHIQRIKPRPLKKKDRKKQY